MTELPADPHAAAGAVDLRPPYPEEAIDGVLPRAVALPRDAQSVARTLARASERGQQVVIRGGGTKLAWGRPPSRLDLLLDMRGLASLVSHAEGDLTATVQAGLTLSRLNAALASRGQCLPIDPPFAEGATVGGLLATNDSGPLRHRFGTPRDLVIGVGLATADGQLARAGGQVVKNVAGYDLSKLVSGSFGGLAAIVEATFKLAPLPPHSATVVVDELDSRTLPELAAALAATQLEPVALDFHAARGGASVTTTCLVRFASVADAVEAQVTATLARVHGAGRATVVSGAREAETWREHQVRLWEGAGAILRVSWLPAHFEGALRALEGLARSGGVEFTGRAALGAGWLRVSGGPDRQASAISELREGGALGNVTIVRGSPELKRSVDVWPALPNPDLLAAVKRAFDPQGVLGADRGPYPPAGPPGGAAAPSTAS